MQIKSEVEIEGIIYPVNVETKRIKSTYVRFENGAFNVSTSPKVSMEEIIKFIKTRCFKLIHKELNVKQNFLFGEYCNELDNLSEEEKFSFYKIKLLEYFDKKVPLYETIMQVKPYKVKVKKVSTRYGSNSLKTRTLYFNVLLAMFSPEIIDSVIVHELAHDFVRNHSDRFYKIVYKFKPDYNELHTKLRKRIFK